MALSAALCLIAVTSTTVIEAAGNTRHLQSEFARMRSQLSGWHNSGGDAPSQDTQIKGIIQLDNLMAACMPDGAAGPRSDITAVTAGMHSAVFASRVTTPGRGA